MIHINLNMIFYTHRMIFCTHVNTFPAETERLLMVTVLMHSSKDLVTHAGAMRKKYEMCLYLGPAENGTNR